MVQNVLKNYMTKCNITIKYLVSKKTSQAASLHMQHQLVHQELNWSFSDIFIHHILTTFHAINAILHLMACWLFKKNSCITKDFSANTNFATFYYTLSNFHRIINLVPSPLLLWKHEILPLKEASRVWCTEHSCKFNKTILH